MYGWRSVELLSGRMDLRTNMQEALEKSYLRIHLQIKMNNVCYSLCICRRPRTTAVNAVVHMREFVSHSIRLRYKIILSISNIQSSLSS